MKLPAEWNWLEPALMGLSALAAGHVIAGAVRIRVTRGRLGGTAGQERGRLGGTAGQERGRLGGTADKKRPTPPAPRLPTCLRHALSWVSFVVSLSASPAMASGRSQAPPSRNGRSLPEAPWLGTSGFLPPHPLVPPGSERPTARSTHPVIHGDAGFSSGATPLFERAGKTSPDHRARERSRRLHPSRATTSVVVEGTRRVGVREGDCLWAIAAEVLATDDPARIDRYWRAIFAANRSVIGTDPDRLLPGQVLELPREATG